MNFKDLTTYLNKNSSEFEIELEDQIDAGKIQENEFIHIISEETVLIKKAKSSSEEYIEAHFVSQKSQNDFEQRSLGKYFCLVTNITDTRLHCLIISDLVIKYEDELNPEGLVIAVLDGVVKTQTVSELNEILSAEYTLDIAGETYYLLAKHLASKLQEQNDRIGDDFTEDTGISSLGDNSFLLVDAAKGSYFSIIPKRFSDINPELGVSSDETYSIESTERRLVHSDQYSYILYKGNIRFEDKTKLHRLQELTKAFVESGGNEYVRRWQLYAQNQHALELTQHDEAGYLDFNWISSEKAGYYRFNINNENAIQNFLANAHKDDKGIAVKITQYLRNGHEIWTKAVMNDQYVPGLGFVECFIDSDDKFNTSLPGTIETDISGSEAVFRRRKAAFDAIQGGNSANKALVYLLSGRTVNSQSGKDLNDSVNLDEKIIAKYFKQNPPNPSQRQAIEYALRTPDFAVIQGPPGTGKTKVIKTIHALLQAQQKNVEAQGDRYLLTAYQRDATKNMAEGVDEEFGLPIIAEYGNRESSDVDASLRDWCDKTREHLESKNQDISYYEDKKRDIIFMYEMKDMLLGKCTANEAKSYIDQALECATQFLDRTKTNDSYFDEKQKIDSVLRQLLEFRKGLDSRLSAESMPKLLSYIRMIPTTAIEFADGGEAMINRVVTELEKLSFLNTIKKKRQELLDAGNIPIDYAKLVMLKIDLILLVTKVEDLYPDEKQEVEAILNELIECMKEHREDERLEIIAEYQLSMYPGPELVETIKQYQKVIAATHQLSNKKGESSYRDVLIDEAARSCPADLMIPMACAENRIIFVGDEKQLPQYIEDEVLKTINPTVPGNEMFDGLSAEAIKAKYECSMFEYMKDRAKELERKDPAHKRVIVLDVQYRMPPVLGTLVSNSFYEGKLHNSDLPLSHFRQEFPLIGGKNLIWIDCSHSGTREKRSASGSRYRECEATVIAKYIKAIAESGTWDYYDMRDENRIGIITFYSKQKAVIKDKLEMLIDDNDITDRIEVGTVDSFQGKEFGIVFLSLVRTNDFDELGFIESKNRMCVALSRAMRCLIVVGNSEILTYKDAEKKIPALIELYKLCSDEEGGVCELLSE